MFNEAASAILRAWYLSSQLGIAWGNYVPIVASCRPASQTSPARSSFFSSPSLSICQESIMQTILVLGLSLLVTFARIDVDSQMETSFHWRALLPDASAGLFDRNLQHFGELRRERIEVCARLVHAEVLRRQIHFRSIGQL